MALTVPWQEAEMCSSIHPQDVSSLLGLSGLGWEEGKEGKDVPVAETLRQAAVLKAVLSTQEAEAEANELFAAGGLSELMNACTPPHTPQTGRVSPDTAHLKRIMSPPYSIPLPDDQVEIPPSILSAFCSEGTDPCALPPMDRAAIRQMVQIEEEEGSEKKTESLLRQELHVVRLQCETLSAELRGLEEERLALELGMARLERALPTHAAWLREQHNKFEELKQAVAAPKTVLSDASLREIPTALMALQAELNEQDTTAKRLLQQNAELEQEGLIKSLNACHAMEMLTTSLKFQRKWCGDAVVNSQRLRQQYDEQQREALARAREEEQLLHKLHQATSMLSERKQSITLIHRRLLGAAPLPNGKYITDGLATVLLTTIKDELSRGLQSTLRALEHSHDFNVLPFPPPDVHDLGVTTATSPRITDFSLPLGTRLPRSMPSIPIPHPSAVSNNNSAPRSLSLASRCQSEGAQERPTTAFPSEAHSRHLSPPPSCPPSLAKERVGCDLDSRAMKESKCLSPPVSKASRNSSLPPPPRTASPSFPSPVSSAATLVGRCGPRTTPSPQHERASSPAHSEVDYQRIQQLQDQAQRQLEGVTATLTRLGVTPKRS